MTRQSIVFCGSNSGGKTTLARELHRVLSPGWGLTDYSRPTMAATKMGRQSARDFEGETDQVQWDFQVQALFEQILAQNSAKLTHKNNIYDRSVYDYLGYLNNKLPFLKGTPQHDLYERLVVENAKDYTHLFFVENNFDEAPIDNGYRLLNNPKIVSYELLQLLKKFGVLFHHVRASTVQTRLTEVMSILNIQ